MDWQSFSLSLQLALVTLALLLPLSIPAAYWLATTRRDDRPGDWGPRRLPVSMYEPVAQRSE